MSATHFFKKDFLFQHLWIASTSLIHSVPKNPFFIYGTNSDFNLYDYFSGKIYSFPISAPGKTLSVLASLRSQFSYSSSLINPNRSLIDRKPSQEELASQANQSADECF